MAASKIENTPWVKLGELIEQSDIRNTDKKYGIDDVCGMTISKEIIPTKADVKDTDLSKFYIVQPNEFVYNPRTHGKKIGLGFNDSKKAILISWNNTAFRVKDFKRLEPAYLYMIFTREEWDREACYNSWGSSTVVFAWEDFCNMKIPLPSIETQRELVAVYNGLKELSEENEKLLEPLSKSCQAFIVDCKNKYPSKRLGDMIEDVDIKNSDNKIKSVKSVSVTKEFKETGAKVNKEELSGYKLVPPKHISYVQTTKNEKCFANALNNSDETYVVTSVNKVIKSKDEKILDIGYLHLFLRRKEFDRYAIFNSWGSAREVFAYEDLCNVQIPVPPIEIQQKIATLYNCYEECKRIATQAREKINNLCPALVQKAAHSN